MTGIAAGSGLLLGAAAGWAGVVAIVCITLVFAALREEWRPGATLAVALAASMLGAWRAGSGGAVDRAFAPTAFPEQAVVVGAPINSGRYQQFIVEPVAGDLDRQSGAPPRICVTAGAAPEVALGDRLSLRGSGEWRVDASRRHQGFLQSRGCDASMYATSLERLGAVSSAGRDLGEMRMRMGRVLRGAVPGDAGVLLTGLVTGDDSGFSPAREEAFQRTGTTHLTAVSGSNLALVAGIFATIGAATIGRHRVPWQAATIGGVWLYAAISGTQPPALRAAIVVTGATLAFIFGRRPDFVTLIVLAAGAMVLLEPRQIDSLGFRLSVAASLALAVVLPPLLDDVRMAPGASFLAATAAAQIATLPFLLPVFGTVSLISIPANVLIAPLAALAMPLALAAALVGLAWQPLGEIVAAPAGVVAAVILGIVDRLGTEQAQVQLGLPPLQASAVIALTCVALVMLLTTGSRHGEARHTLDAMLSRKRSPDTER